MLLKKAVDVLNQIVGYFNDIYNVQDGDEEPMIYHGHTLTSKIKFSDVVLAVKDYGFKSSPYPIILSLEMHCNKENQLKMAHIFTNILGNLIYILPWNADLIPFYPSPDQLKYKVLIKASGKFQECLKIQK